MPDKWVAPIVEGFVLPAHAQTSGVDPVPPDDDQETPPDPTCCDDGFCAPVTVTGTAAGDVTVGSGSLSTYNAADECVTSNFGITVACSEDVLLTVTYTYCDNDPSTLGPSSAAAGSNPGFGTSTPNVCSVTVNADPDLDPPN